MGQLFIDDAYKAFRTFESMADRIEFGSPMRVKNLPVPYEGSGRRAFAVYENTGKKTKTGGFIFKKKELIFEKVAS